MRWPVFACAALFAMVVLWFSFLYATLDLPETPEPVSSVVLDVNGREVATISGEEYRREVTLEEMSPHVVDALLAAEDRRFYDHGGVDPVGIARAHVDQRPGRRAPRGQHHHAAAGEERVPHHRTHARPARSVRRCWP